MNIAKRLIELGWNVENFTLIRNEMTNLYDVSLPNGKSRSHDELVRVYEQFIIGLYTDKDGVVDTELENEIRDDGFLDGCEDDIEMFIRIKELRGEVLKQKRLNNLTERVKTIRK